MNDTFIYGKCFICGKPCGDEGQGYGHMVCVTDSWKKDVEKRKELKRIKKEEKCKLKSI